MSLGAGSRLGPYEITAKLGEGGMGEVYRATDSRLKREVAIKVLPAAFTEDKERLARFEREAQLLAQLNHPNIAQIYGIETSGATHALVMELVDGPTLAERLEQGPFSLTEGFSFALQIAQALEEAHDKGIVHRDLKPQNVKASSEGNAKVLDFGLAKAMDATSGSASAADFARSPTIMNSPTLTAVHGTQLGVILGTAAYMAPEQARGAAVDKRADIWAFGVVLYEMLTGRSLFAGPTVSDTLAGVLKTEIDWRALPSETPTEIRRLLRRCLERNPKERLHDIADARIVLAEVLVGKSDEVAPTTAGAVAAPRSRPTRWALAGVAGALVLGLAGGLLLARADANVDPELRFPIALPGDWKFADADVPLIALSRDGRRRAVAAVNATGKQAILVGEVDQVDWRILEDTGGAQAPFFSPDGGWIGYFGEGTLRRIAAAGGPSLPLAKVGNQVRGAAWLPDGTIVYSPDAGEVLWRVSADGGEPQPLTALNKALGERTHRWPDSLPGGKAILFTVDSDDTTEFYDDAQIAAVVVATGERKVVLRDSSAARYLDPGVLIFARGGALFATRFDPVRLETQGSPVPVLQQVATNVTSGAVQFALSATGALLWAPGSASSAGSLPVWIDRQGGRSAPLVAAGTHTQLALSLDGKRLALVAAEGQKSDLWIVDLERGSRSRLTFDGDVADPTWSADSRRVAYDRTGAAVGGGADIFWKPADGSGEAESLVSGPELTFPGSFSPDGRYLAFDHTAPGTSNSDIWIQSLDSGSEQKAVVATEAQEFNGRFSPDGRWLAYLAAAAGRTELYVRPFPTGSGRWQVSTGGATEPHWSADATELFFRQAGTLYRVAVSNTGSGGAFVASSPERVASGFRPGDNLRSYSPAPDGKRFAALPGYETSETAVQVNLALHWNRDVRRLLKLDR